MAGLSKIYECCALVDNSGASQNIACDTGVIIWPLATLTCGPCAGTIPLQYGRASLLKQLCVAAVSANAEYGLGDVIDVKGCGLTMDTECDLTLFV